MTLVGIILLVIFLASLPDHKKHPEAQAGVEYGWIILAIILLASIMGAIRGCTH